MEKINIEFTPLPFFLFEDERSFILVVSNKLIKQLSELEYSIINDPDFTPTFDLMLEPVSRSWGLDYNPSLPREGLESQLKKALHERGYNIVNFRYSKLNKHLIEIEDESFVRFIKAQVLSLMFLVNKLQGVPLKKKEPQIKEV